jgi:hypothetical protein
MMVNNVPMSFVTRVCEAVYSKTKPGVTTIVIGAVSLKLFIKQYGTTYERFMLIGDDWSLGFNAFVKGSDTENLEAVADPTEYRIFLTNMRIFDVAVHDDENFIRDMAVLRMTEHEWAKEFAS